jgi:type I restriction enzyme S subunit
LVLWRLRFYSRRSRYISASAFSFSIVSFDFFIPLFVQPYASGSGAERHGGFGYAYYDGGKYIAVAAYQDGSEASAWEQRKLGESIVECTERTSDFSAYPLYSLTIENGVTKKTERYERSFLVRKETDLFKVVPPECFVTNPMNLRFGAVGYNDNAHSVSVSGYYDVFSIDGGECSSFWSAYLKTNLAMKKYDDVATGSLIEKRKVHFSELKRIEFLAPTTLEEKLQIGTFFAAFDNLLTLHQREPCDRLSRSVKLSLNSIGNA